MANTYFRFKQFVVNQENCSMKVGTDGVLLGAYANPKKAQHILDIGTGTGLLSLMMAQKSKAKITAIEINKLAYLQAVENFNNSKWNNRIYCINDSIQQFTKSSIQQYDYILCNPPYFQNSLKSKNKARNIARHTDYLSIENLIQSISKLLSPNGFSMVIYPFDVLEQLQKLCQFHGLFISRKILVFPKPGVLPKRVIVEFSKQVGTIHNEEIIIEESGRHNYSKKYIAITKDFYLDF